MVPILTAYVVPTVHVLACLFLIVVVLLQTGKGADMGAVFGGGSQTLFGSSGAGNFLTKLTTGVAITFMVTSLFLSLGERDQPASDLFDRLPAASVPLDLPPVGAAPEGPPVTGDAADATAPTDAATATAEAPATGDVPGAGTAAGATEGADGTVATPPDAPTAAAPSVPSAEAPEPSAPATP